MTVSVIIPVYNCEEFLPACLDSVLAQTYRQLQIILIDDGSKDGSGAICDRYAAMDQRIQVVHQVNQGVSAARNAGLELATGELIAFVDGDDAVLPDMYEFLVGLLQTHQADIAHCGYRRIHADGSVTDVKGTGVLLLQSSDEACEDMIAGRNFTGSPCTKLYRRSLFEGLRFHRDLKINEDILMNVELFRRTEKTVFQDVPKYCYFQRTQSATHVVLPLKARRDCAKVFMQVMEMFQDTPIAPTAARRLVYTQLDLYRACLFGDAKGTRQERKEIHQTIQTYAAAYGVNRGRQMWNYRFMRYLPWLYVPVYRLYDKIRKPNIDL